MGKVKIKEKIRRGRKEMTHTGKEGIKMKLKRLERKERTELRERQRGISMTLVRCNCTVLLVSEAAEK